MASKPYTVNVKRLKSVDIRTRHVVQGFIHEAEKSVKQAIPSIIINCCLIFYYIFPEQFNDKLSGTNIKLSSTNLEKNHFKTLTHAQLNRSNNKYESVFGTFIIDCKRDKGLVFQWKIKGSSYVGIIGVNYNQNVLNNNCFNVSTTDCHFCDCGGSIMEAKCNNKHSNATRIDGRLNANYNGNVIIMTMNINKGMIMYTDDKINKINTGFDNLSFSGKYQFAAVLSNGQSVEIIDFKIYTQKEYLNIVTKQQEILFNPWQNNKCKGKQKKSKKNLKRKFSIKTK